MFFPFPPFNPFTNYIYGTSNDDILTGDADWRFLNDVIYGYDGDDTIYGGVGKDTIYGGTGNDDIVGSAGADYIDGGSGIDLVSYVQGSTEAVNVNLAAGTGQGGFAEGDRLVDIENVHGTYYDDMITGNGDANLLYGFAGDDELSGGGGRDTIDGGDGDDTIDGGAGDDYLYGSGGNDTIIGGGGTDTVDYDLLLDGLDIDLGLEYAETLNSNSQYYQYDQLYGIENAVGSSVDDEIYGSNGANDLYGNEGNDYIEGRRGDDALLGGKGDDTLNGGQNDDVLAGGSGEDIFEFGERGRSDHGDDYISDFEPGIDKIDLSYAQMRDYDDLFSPGERYWEDVTDEFGAKSVVIHTGGSSITIADLQIADLDAGDFLF